MRTDMTTTAAVNAGYKKFHDEMSNGQNVHAAPANHNKRMLESSKRQNGAEKPIVADGFFSKCRSKVSEFSGFFSRAKNMSGGKNGIEKTHSRPESGAIIHASKNLRNLPATPSDKWWSSSVSGEYVAAEKSTPGYQKFKAMIRLTVETYRLKLDVGQPAIANISECHTAYDNLFLKAYDSAYENLRREGKSMQEALRVTYGQANAQVLNELRSEGGYSQYVAVISQRELVIKEPVSKSDGKPTFPLFSSVAGMNVEAFRENFGKAWEIAKSKFVPPSRHIESESKTAKILRQLENPGGKAAVELTPAASLTADDLKGIYQDAFESAYKDGVSAGHGSTAAVLSAHQSGLDKVSGNLPSFEHKMVVARFKEEFVSLEPALAEGKKSPSVQFEKKDSVRENIVKPELSVDVSRAEGAMQTSGDAAIEESIKTETPFSFIKWAGMKASNFFSKKSSKLESQKIIDDLKISSPMGFRHEVQWTPEGVSILGVDQPRVESNLPEFQLASSVTPESKARSSSSNASDEDRISSRTDSERPRAPSLTSLASTTLSMSSAMSSWSPDVSLTLTQTPSPVARQTNEIPVSSNEAKLQERPKTMLSRLISILPKRSQGYKLTDLTSQDERHVDISTSTYVSEPGHNVKADRYDEGSKKVRLLNFQRMPTFQGRAER
jgi:hypothetical protein